MKEYEMEYPACNLCGSEQRQVLIRPRIQNASLEETFSASQGILGAQEVVRCLKCNLIYACPRLSSERIRAAYTDSADELYVSQAQSRIATFRKCVMLISRYAHPPGRLLDVGAAAGFFVKAATDAGWTSIGVEPSRWLAEWGQKHLGVEVRPGELNQQSFRDSEFDVITMWDCLEHMTDPRSALEQCRRILKEQGFLIINTPNIGSLPARVFGPRWWFLLSHHIYYFSPQTISLLLDKCGFELVATRRHYQSLELGHLAKMLGLYSKRLSSAVEFIFRFLRISSLSVPYYAGQMNVIAQKRKEPRS